MISIEDVKNILFIQTEAIANFDFQIPIVLDNDGWLLLRYNKSEQCLDFELQDGKIFYTRAIRTENSYKHIDSGHTVKVYDLFEWLN